MFVPTCTHTNEIIQELLMHRNVYKHYARILEKPPDAAPNVGAGKRENVTCNTGSDPRGVAFFARRQRQ